MLVTKFLYTFIFISLVSLQNCFSNPLLISDSSINSSDTLKEDQLLYIGKIWNNKYFRVKGDEFLFTNYSMNGSVSINGRYYKNVTLKYDIYNDALLIPTNLGRLIQLNKEMVDCFSLNFGDRIYNFERSRNDSASILDGYYNVLYKGKLILCVKYIKEIQLLAIDRKYDLFYERHDVFVIKDSITYKVNTKHSLLKIMGEEKDVVKKYIHKNKLRISKKVPDNYIPVLKFYDSLPN
jgi:hypothetical protein